MGLFMCGVDMSKKLLELIGLAMDFISGVINRSEFISQATSLAFSLERKFAGLPIVIKNPPLDIYYDTQYDKTIDMIVTELTAGRGSPTKIINLAVSALYLDFMGRVISEIEDEYKDLQEKAKAFGGLIFFLGEVSRACLIPNSLVAIPIKEKGGVSILIRDNYGGEFLARSPKDILRYLERISSNLIDSLVLTVRNFLEKSRYQFNTIPETYQKIILDYIKKDPYFHDLDVSAILDVMIFAEGDSFDVIIYAPRDGSFTVKEKIVKMDLQDFISKVDPESWYTEVKFPGEEKQISGLILKRDPGSVLRIREGGFDYWMIYMNERDLRKKRFTRKTSVFLGFFNKFYVISCYRGT